MAIPIIIVGQEVEAIVDCGASGLVVGRVIASRLGVWKRARKINVRQADKSKLRRGHYVINDSITIPGATSTLDTNTITKKFSLDTEVFDIGQKEVVLGL